jgi:hypothetical protein
MGWRREGRGRKREGGAHAGRKSKLSHGWGHSSPTPAGLPLPTHPNDSRQCVHLLLLPTVTRCNLHPPRTGPSSRIQGTNSPAPAPAPHSMWWAGGKGGSCAPPAGSDRSGGPQCCAPAQNTPPWTRERPSGLAGGNSSTATCGVHYGAPLELRLLHCYTLSV